jgi:hypothetical protein
MTSTQQTQAALLLKSLDEAAKSNELTIITPALMSFIDTTDKLNNKLIGNISGYKEVIDESNTLINDVINFNVDGSRSKFADSLKAFSVNGTWSVYAQKYNNKPIPLVTQEGPLQKIVWTYNQVHKVLDANYESTDVKRMIDEIVSKFEIAYTNEILKYQNEHMNEIDFTAAWSGTRMSAKKLYDDPHFAHVTWLYFFTNKTKSIISKLVANIQEALVYYTRNIGIKNRLKKSNAMTDEVIEESDRIRENTLGFLRRDGELKLLKVAGEQSGDVEQTAKFNEADELNLVEFESLASIKPATPFTDTSHIVKTDEDIANDIFNINGDGWDVQTEEIGETSNDKDDSSEISSVGVSDDDEDDDDDDDIFDERHVKRKLDVNMFIDAVDRVTEKVIGKLETKKRKKATDVEVATLIKSN